MIAVKYFQICDICGHERSLTKGQFEFIKSNCLDRNVVFYVEGEAVRDLCPDCYSKLNGLLKKVKESEESKND